MLWRHQKIPMQTRSRSIPCVAVHKQPASSATRALLNTDALQRFAYGILLMPPQSTFLAVVGGHTASIFG